MVSYKYGKDIFTIKEEALSYARWYLYSLQYHLVWCTNYRKQLLKNGIDAECKKMMYELAEASVEFIVLCSYRKWPKQGSDNGLCGGTKREGKKKVGNFMQIVSSYGVEIKQKNIPLCSTLDIFRKAVSYLIPVYAQIRKVCYPQKQWGYWRLFRQSMMYTIRVSDGVDKVIANGRNQTPICSRSIRKSTKNC